MTSRERYIETLVHGNNRVPALKWEFGYWGQSLNNWYKEGLPKKDFAHIPTVYSDISNSVYTYAWLSQNKHIKPGEYPSGYALSGGNMPMGSQGFACDNDIRDYFHMDKIQQRVDINLFFDPIFEPKTIEDTDDKLIYFDIDGATRVFLKDTATIPSVIDNPIKDRTSWEKIKEERLNIKRIGERFTAEWKTKVEDYKERDYPLVFNGYPWGFFGALAHLMGYETLFYAYYDDPEWVHDIMQTLTDLWIAIFEEVLMDVDVDGANIWEDISFGSGCMLPMKIMREFMLPYYQRMTSFLKDHGVNVIFVDTDGDCWDIIPFFIECGANGMYPFETQCGMDIVKVRNLYPDLIIGGGISHDVICAGKQKIDETLDSIAPVIRNGKYIPFGDHFIPPDVHFEEFKYYRERLNELIDSV